MLFAKGYSEYTMYNTVMFDLDGTLTESAQGIITSATIALEHFGIKVEDKSKLTFFVGPPLYETFTERYNMSSDDAHEAIRVFREFYDTEGLFINSVYDGIPELLENIKSTGRKVCVATSKPEITAKRVIEHFDLMKYFDIVAGASVDSSRISKAGVIDYLIKQFPEADRDLSRIVMVGDRRHDVAGAKEIGVDCIGVLYGYGDREELEMAGAKYIAEKPMDVLDYLS